MDEVTINDVKQSIHSNSTITSSGSQILGGYGAQQISLVVNVKASPTGTTPTITFTLQEIDPGDGTTTFGSTATTSAINAIGVYTATLNTTTSGTIKVSWTVTGTTPSFTALYSTVAAKVTPTSQAVTSAPSNAVSGFSLGQVTVASTALTAIRFSTYNEQSSNAGRSISSASTSDTSAGTGARQVKITYYDSSGNGPNTETVTLNGTTAVNTVSTTICYIEGITVTSVGTGGSNAGILTLFVGTGGAGGTLGTINATENQDFWAHHYVATGKTCNVTGIAGQNTNSSNGSILTLRAKPIGGTSP